MAHEAYVEAVTRMRVAVSRSAPIERPADVARVGLRLAAGAALCLLAAGTLLWWQQGSAIFAAFVNGALAWCM